MERLSVGREEKVKEAQGTWSRGKKLNKIQNWG